ncbi:MAG: Trk system potassium transporter TrkA [Victivallales bacterium]|nr:Trk system potassium transporter TrkA [Victivallales bacterium]
MRIVIIGAGELGQLLAERLSASSHDVSIIDTDKAEFERVRDKLDVMTIVGDATSVAVMKRAGVAEADLLIAASGNHATNILACQIARQLGCKSTLCRLFSEDVFSEEDGVVPGMFGVEKAFSSPAECARHILHVLRRHIVLEEIEFSNPEATMVAIRIPPSSPLCHKSLKDIPNPELLGNVRFAAQVRERQLKVPHGDSRLEANDRVYVTGRRDYVQQFLEFAAGQEPSRKKLILLGGATQLGELLAQACLDEGMQVAVIEPSLEDGEAFLEKMHGRISLYHGSTTEEDILLEAGIESCDAFVDTGDDDEKNILSCVLAKRLGAAKVIAITHKPEYIDIVPEMELIDCGFNTTVESINAVFRLMNEGLLRIDSHLKSFQAYLTEFKIQPGSRLIGKKLKDAQLPKATILAMIFRGTEVSAPAGNTVLKVGDIVVAIVTPVTEELLKPYFS